MRFFLWRPGDREPGVDHELIWGALGLLVLGIARLVPPALTNWYKCPFNSATGVPCLTCGMTRSFRFTVHGEWVEAFSLNPLGSVLCILTGLYVLYALVLVVFRLPRPRFRLESRIARWSFRLGLPLILLVNWIYLFCHGV